MAGCPLTEPWPSGTVLEAPAYLPPRDLPCKMGSARLATSSEGAILSDGFIAHQRAFSFYQRTENRKHHLQGSK